MRDHVLLRKAGWAPFKTPELRRAEWRKSKARMEKFLSNNRLPSFRRKFDAALAQELVDPYNGSAYCRRVQLAFEREVIRQLATVMSKVPGSAYCVTIIRPREKLLSRKELAVYDWAALKKSILRSMQKLKAENRRMAAVGRVDFSLAIDAQGRTRVRPHVHLVIIGADLDAIKHHLRPAKGQGELPVKRPLRVDAVKDQGALKYALKTRISGVHSPTDDGRKPRHSYPDAKSKKAFDLFLLRHTQSELMLNFGIRRDHGKYRLTSVPE